MRVICRRTAFHGGGVEPIDYPNIKRALTRQERHAKECACGGPIPIIVGTQAELDALGAYVGPDGRLFLSHDLGLFVCEVVSIDPAGATRPRP